MNFPARFAAGLSLVAIGGFAASAHAATASCASLAGMTLPDTRITTAEEVTSGSFAMRTGAPLAGLPPFCRVAATTTPMVNFELWLPLTGWNGKFQGVGNGANAGSINYRELSNALKRGYAVASTDTGHQTTNARDASWALGHPERVIDFGYRAIHVTADNSKKIVAQFYAEPARYSYFMSCSAGGRQALAEAQRYPEDYDGIIAGAPTINWSQFQAGGHMWAAAALNKDPESYLPSAKLKALGDAVNAACDKLDGVADGVLGDPRQCKYDAKALQCPAGKDDASCLTPKQVKAVNDIWAGARTKRGKLIYPGVERGAEAAADGWETYMTGEGLPGGTHWDGGVTTLKYIVFENESWDPKSFEVERDAAFARKKSGEVMDMWDADLSRFQARGGRLLMYHGWNDPNIAARNTITYYEAVLAAMKKKLGARKTASQDSVRLFMAPGTLHCSGGPGASTFEMLPVMEQWVENKQTPERIIASHQTKGVSDSTRPLCAWPKAAVYNGSGSTDDAANFTCKTGK